MRSSMREMKSESGFSFAIASQPFWFGHLKCHFRCPKNKENGTTSSFLSSFVLNDRMFQIILWSNLDILDSAITSQLFLFHLSEESWGLHPFGLPPQTPQGRCCPRGKQRSLYLWESPWTPVWSPPLKWLCSWLWSLLEAPKWVKDPWNGPHLIPQTAWLIWVHFLDPFRGL